MRDGDVVGRWGGEKFLILCTGLTEEQLLSHANSQRNRISYFHFGECETVTASFGICTRTGVSLVDLVSDADAALNSAKNRDRNRVEVFTTTLRKAA